MYLSSPDFSAFTGDYAGFIAKHKAKYGGSTLSTFHAHAYDAANIILTAMQQTGNTDGSKVAEYISKNTFHGAFGDISFDKNGDVTKAPYVIWQVKDGKFVEVQ